MNHYPVIGYEKESWMGTYVKHLYNKYQIQSEYDRRMSGRIFNRIPGKRKFRDCADAAGQISFEHADGINIHRLKGLQIYRQVFMFWMKDRYRLPAVERFIELYEGTAG